MIFLVFDFETTGLKPGRHEPIQVAALLLDDNMTELGAFDALMRPLLPELASPEALAVNGRSLADLAAEPHPREVLGRFAEFVAAAREPVVMVGHNVGFDLEFLRHAEATHELAFPRREAAVDTCDMARIHLESRGAIANSKLATVASYYGIEFRAHDALGDVRATAGLLDRFKAEAPALVDRAIEGTLLGGLVTDARVAQPDNPFVSSVASHFDRNGWLSARQIGALVRIAEQGVTTSILDGRRLAPGVSGS